MIRLASPVPLALLLLVGCAHGRCRLPSLATADVAPVLAGYRLACPDAVEVRFVERPDWDSFATVGTDGNLTIGPSSVKVAVAGYTVEEVRGRIAESVQVRDSTIQVQVVAPRAGHVDLFGPQANFQRVVAFRGPESVMEFLLRTGAWMPGCSDPHDVSVLRPNVADGRAAELFRVEVERILQGDPRTNLTLQPGDQVYVGESRRSSFARLLPDRLEPLYRRLMGLTAERPTVSRSR